MGGSGGNGGSGGGLGGRQRRFSASSSKQPNAAVTPVKKGCASESSSAAPVDGLPYHGYDLRRKSSASPSADVFKTPTVLVPSNEFTSSLVAPKRVKRAAQTGEATLSSELVGGQYLQNVLPDEVLLHILSYLLEFDLSSTAQVCKRFSIIANDRELWRKLYREVYEYLIPLINPEPKVYKFVHPDFCGMKNPWQHSFRLLYRALHVRPSYAAKVEENPERWRGRNILYFETITAALSFLEENGCKSLEDNAMVLIHAGVYTNECLCLDDNITILGAAGGLNVAERVIIERQTDSVCVCYEGTKETYVGYVTLKVCQLFPGYALHLSW